MSCATRHSSSPVRTQLLVDGEVSWVRRRGEGVVSGADEEEVLVLVLVEGGGGERAEGGGRCGAGAEAIS